MTRAARIITTNLRIQNGKLYNLSNLLNFMPEISLPREATGQELVDVIKVVAGEIDFEYYDSNGNISVGREFPEHVPEKLRFAFDVTPSLEFRFGKIEPQKNYANLECQTMIGTMMMQPTDFQGEEAKYKPHYDNFVQGVTQNLQ